MPPSFFFPLFYIGGTHFSAVKLSCKNTTLQSFLAFFAKNSFFLNLYPHSCLICQKSAHPAGYSVPSRNHPRILSPRLLPIPFGLSVPRLSCSLASPLLNPLRIHFTICSHVFPCSKSSASIRMRCFCKFPLDKSGKLWYLIISNNNHYCYGGFKHEIRMSLRLRL